MKKVATVKLYLKDNKTLKQRKDIAKWLRRTASNLEKEGDQYSPFFKAQLFWV